MQSGISGFRMSNVLVEKSPRPLRSFRHQNIDFYVYDTPDAMGMASAAHLAERQLELAQHQETVGFLIMAAPSGYPFYGAYAALAEASHALQVALSRTHFFQFDEYPLPAEHPASYSYLLRKRFFSRLQTWLPPENVHLLNLDCDDPAARCREYAKAVLDTGPDLQLKGMGENGHWGFHEPGIPLDEDPAYMHVALSEENVVQQFSDHPDLFRDTGEVPREAYTANVPLFLRTRHLIEDNVPQASKAFALLAAYGNDVAHPAVPSSALKRHADAVVRTTAEASWALEEYLARGCISKQSLERVLDTLAAGAVAGAARDRDRVARVLRDMEIAFEA